MSTILDFKCKTCDKTFTLSAGLMQADLLGVNFGMDLPNEAKLPSKEEFAEMYRNKTAENTEKFIQEVDKHSCECKGEVVLGSVILAH